MSTVDKIRVIRGGAFDYIQMRTPCIYRSGGDPAGTGYNVSFRLASKHLQTPKGETKMVPSIEMIAIPGKDFSLGKYPVTQAQWVEVMGTNPSYFKGGDLPVTNVSWKDCKKFIKKLRKLSGIHYRLPTEQEWEYACKGGEDYKYAGSDDINDVAWHYENSGNTLHPVGKKKPNGYGLYDMLGNVWEWMQDEYR